MPGTLENKRSRKISRGSVTSGIPKLPPINEANANKRRNRNVTQWLQAQPQTDDNCASSGVPMRRRLSSISGLSDVSATRRNSVCAEFKTPTGTELQSGSRAFSYNPPSTVATFLRPDFRKGYVFGYSLVVNAVLQRYNHFLIQNTNDDEAVFEQNPAEVWLTKLTDIHSDKVFMKMRKDEEKKYVEKRARELGSRSTDTFVTQRAKGAGASRSTSRMSSSSHAKSINPSVISRAQRNGGVKQKLN